MADLRLVRDFDTTPERLFQAVSTPKGLLAWWGPEGMTLPDHDLDFTRTGPWFSVMQNSEGQRYKVSGHVTHVDPPRSVGLTWAWHDETDTRGSESHVTLTVTPIETGARLTLDHRDLGDDESAGNHEAGWTSALSKIEHALR